MQENFVNEERNFENAMPHTEIPPECNSKNKKRIRLSKIIKRREVHVIEVNKLKL